MAAQSLIVFFALCAFGILLSLVVRPQQQPRVLAWIGCLAAFALLLAGGEILLAGGAFTHAFWSLPGLTILTVSGDPISGVFLAVTGLVLMPCSIFAACSLGERSPGGDERSFTVKLFALYAAIVLVYVAADAVLFLLAWEVMSILCYLLIAANLRSENGSAGAGYLLLGMGEAGTIAIAVGFLVLGMGADSFTFSAIRSAAAGTSSGARWAIFLLTFFGFGVKAGLVPVNSWLPRAYTASSSAFVPVLAGATLNLGIYGIVRFNGDLAPAVDTVPGLVALAIGATSALIGILYATTDDDLKMMLAHSSIENVGIAVAGVGAGMVFAANRQPALAAIAFVAALYHMANHSLYKTLLFFGVGVVENSTGTRNMDGLGGLIRWMPLTALGVLAGTLAIAGLPPFNGFVSEWLTLQTMLRSAELGSTHAKIVFALCGAALALTAALAVTCFVKLFAMTFLGMRRLDPERTVAEPGYRTLAPIAILAVLCLAFGTLPTYVIAALDSATSRLAGARPVDVLVPPFFAPRTGHEALPAAFADEFHDLGAQVGAGIAPGRGLVVLHRGGEKNPVVFAMSTSYMLPALIALLLLAWAIVRGWLARARRVSRNERWDGGVRRLLPEMTYSATGFSNPVRVIFDAIFRPTTVEDTSETVAEHFRMAIRREKERVHLVDRLLFHPVHDATLWLARLLASMHHGRINAYAAYAFLALLIVLAVIPTQ